MRIRISTLIIVLTLLSLLILAVFIDKMGTDKNTNLAVVYPSISPKQVNTEKLAELVNEYRNKRGLNRLVTDTDVCLYAEGRLKSVSDNYSHDGFYITFLPSKFTYQGENLSRGSVSEDSILLAWVNSPSHNENLLGKWSYMCIKSQYSDVVQIFAR